MIKQTCTDSPPLKKNQMNDNIDMDGTIVGSYKDLDMYKVDPQCGGANTGSKNGRLSKSFKNFLLNKCPGHWPIHGMWIY